MTGLEETINSEETKILRELTSKGYSPSDIKQFINALQKQESNNTKPYKVGKNKVRIAIFGDTHIGNIHYDTELMKLFKREIKKQKVDMILNTGDIFDGWYQNRPASLFEQNAIGFDAQLRKAVEEFKGIEQPIYFITGNHSYNTFVRGAGVEAGPYFENLLAEEGMESHYLGNAEGDIELGNKTKIKLLHPDGGTAYALSYRPQKIVESLSGGEKPDMLLIGHFHKMEYFFYRNVHVFQTGTLMGQTKFMRGKNIPAHKGFYIVDIYGRSNRKGIDKLMIQPYTAYK